MAAVLTFTLWLETTIFNGPVALIAYAGLPAALVGMVCGALGMKSEGRNKAIVGTALSLIVLLAWFLIVAMPPYPEP